MNFGLAPPYSAAVLFTFLLAGNVGAIASVPDDQRVADSEPDSTVLVTSGDRARQIVASFADCAVAKRRDLVDKVLATEPESRAQAHRVRQLKATTCNRNLYLIVDDAQVRGALYEALYVREFSARPQPSLAAVGPLAPSMAAQSEGKNAQLARLAGIFADCVTRKNPMGTRELILAKIGSKREAAAFGALAADLSYCLAPGAQMKFSRVVLRGYIAEALYRLSSQAVAGQPTTSVH